MAINNNNTIVIAYVQQFIQLYRNSKFLSIIKFKIIIKNLPLILFLLNSLIHVYPHTYLNTHSFAY